MKTETVSRVPHPHDHVEMMAAGHLWDVVRVPKSIGLHALNELTTDSGIVIEDTSGGVLYWFIHHGTAEGWDLREVQVLGEASYVAVPPVTRIVPPGLHWRIVNADPMTNPVLLYAALDSAVRRTFGPRETA
ncbi:hypothetical protein [Streptomyces sp. NPDC056707]|uniref:hypothetical protein n=1 Tax=Streptomyces sp. NPDC056707 TaxID=3345919 RepID=UPI0036BBBF9A